MFVPTRVSPFVSLAPQNSSFRDSSTIGRLPVASSSSPNVDQFCASLTRRHHRIILTLTCSQSGRESLR